MPYSAAFQRRGSANGAGLTCPLRYNKCVVFIKSNLKYSVYRVTTCIKKKKSCTAICACTGKISLRMPRNQVDICCPWGGELRSKPFIFTLYLPRHCLNCKIAFLGRLSQAGPRKGTPWLWCQEVMGSPLMSPLLRGGT